MHGICQNVISHVWSLYLKHLWWGLCIIVKLLVLSSTNRETLVNLTHAYFHHIQSYTRRSVDLSVDLSSCGSVKKFTDVYFFINFPTRQNITNRTSSNNVMLYLKLESSLQWIVCSPNIFKHALKQTRQTSSIGKKES